MMRLLRRCALVCVSCLVLTLVYPTTGINAQTPQPDLFLNPLSFVLLGRDAQGNCVGKVRLNVVNKGDAKAGPFVVGFTLHPNVFVIPVPNGLPVNSSIALSQEVVVSPGEHLVRAKADAEDVVIESNEHNNSRAQIGTCPLGSR